MAKLLISLLVFGFAALQGAAIPLADPDPAPYPMAEGGVPEVIPGPGLPSLKELNLTSAQLYAMGMPEPAVRPRGYGPVERSSSSRLERRAHRCGGPNEDVYADVAGAVACYNFILAVNRENTCRMERGQRMANMCRSGNTMLMSWSAWGLQQWAVCADFAIASLWVLDGCTRPDKKVAGYNTLPGQPGFFAGFGSVKYFDTEDTYGRFGW